MGEGKFDVPERSAALGERAEVPGTVVVARDARAISQAETALAASEARWQFALEGSGDGVWDWDLTTGHVFFSHQWKAMLGYDDDEVGDTTDEWTDRIHPDDRERCWAVLQAHLDGEGPSFTFEHRMQAKDGTWRWILDRGKVVERGADGSARRVIGTHTDVTAVRSTRDELERSVEALRRAERLARMGHWSLDLATGELTSSEMLYELNGTDPDGPPLTVHDMERLLDAESFKKVGDALARCVATGEPYAIDIRQDRPDGANLALHVQGAADRDDQGRVVGVTGTVLDMTEREEASARLEALADNLPEGAIFRLERTSPGAPPHFTYISAGIEALVGISAPQLMRTPSLFASLLHPDDRTAFAVAVARSQPTLTNLDLTVRIQAPQGEQRRLRARAVPRRLLDGTTVWDGLFLDVTAEHAAAELLREAKEEAEAAVRAQDDFLATMSHEIRSPMNTVVGMTRLTLQGELTPKQRNHLEKVELAARSLLSIVNDVLDLSKIEADQLQLEEVDFTIDSVLDSVSAITAPRAEESGVELAFAIARRVPRLLHGDPMRLGQVLTNLVGNALKFTREGEVVVAIDLDPHDADSSRVRFSVHDTGMGIAGDTIAGLFRPFTQAEARTARLFGGTGLGLSICRHLVEMMGGTIGATSTLGRGSTFWFTIAGAVPADGIDPEGERRRGGLDGRVLIVDDNLSARSILADTARDFGMEAETAASGPDGVLAVQAAAVEGRPFDLALVDLHMPEVDGLETARRLGHEPSATRPRVLLLVTAFAEGEVLEHLERSGIERVLVKPITESALFDTLAEVLGGHEASGAPTEPSSPGWRSRPAPAIAPLLQGRRILVVDDDALNREVATEFLLAVGAEVHTATDGREALVRLWGADFDAVLMDLHMPEMDGLAATREIRRHPRWQHLPIVALTAQVESGGQAASLSAGFSAHLLKPIDEQLLYATLIELMAATPRETVPDQPPRQGASGTIRAGAGAGAGAGGPGIDIEAVSRRLGHDAERALRFLRGFARDYTDTPDRVVALSAAGDLASLAGLAHQVRGSAGYLGAAGLAEAAARLEAAARGQDVTASEALAETFRAQLRLVLDALEVSLAAVESRP